MKLLARQLIGGFLALLLAAPAYSRELTVQEQVGKVQLGAKIEVTLASSEVLKGRRGAFSNTGFSLEPMKGGAGSARAIEFQDVKHVRRTGLNTAEKVAIISAVALAGVVLGVYLWAKASGC